MSPEVLSALLAPSPWFRLRCLGVSVALVSALEDDLAAAVVVAVTPPRHDADDATAAALDLNADGHSVASSSAARTPGRFSEEMEAERQRALNDPENQEGGFLPCIPGDRIGNKYVLVRELGRGESSKVWLAREAQPPLAQQQRERDGLPAREASAAVGGGSGPLFAIKVYRSEERLRDSMMYERALMRFVTRRCNELAAGRGDSASESPSNSPHRTRSNSSLLADEGEGSAAAGISALRDDFVQAGPHGDHPCLVFDVLGPAVDWVMKAYDFQGIPHRAIVRDIVRATLRTLIQLERINVVHTDLKPENLLFAQDQRRLNAMMDALDAGESSAGGSDFSVRFIDFGLSYIIPPEHRSSAATAALTTSSTAGRSRAPRSTVQRPPSKEELELLHLGNYTKGAIIQTREYRAPEILLGTHFGTKADVWSLGCMVFELVSGQFLFDPKSHPDVVDERSMDARHLYEISTVCGAPPPQWLQRGRGEHAPLYFDVKSWKFKGRPLRTTPARDLAADLAPFAARYMPDDASAHREAELIADFVSKCIQWDPSKRASPSQLLDHPWLN